MEKNKNINRKDSTTNNITEKTEEFFECINDTNVSENKITDEESNENIDHLNNDNHDNIKEKTVEITMEQNLETKKETDKISNGKNLKKSGILTALAIGIHNFPEGLITFIASLDDPKIGAILAIAISIHNIPEGICVAIPMYYATNS